MCLESIHIALFVGVVASIRFVAVLATAADADVVADRHRETIDNVVLLGIEHMMDVRNHCEYGLPESLRNGVQAAIED